MSAYTHSRDRAAERYDVNDITKLDLIHISKAITSGMGSVCLSKNDRRGVYMVRYRDTIWKVCFDFGSEKIISILPPVGSLRGGPKKRGQKRMSKNQITKKIRRARARGDCRY